jgi:DNA modification methylase
MELNKIYHMDYLEGLKAMPDNSIDMILTDPPYGTTQNKWDKPVDLAAMWQELRRVAKDDAAILVFSQMPYTVDLVAANRRQFRYEWILEKNNATGFLNARRMPLKAHETVCVFYKHLPQYNPIMEKGGAYVRGRGRKSSNYGEFTDNEHFSVGGRFPRDVLKVQWRKPWGETLHPTQKPVDICEYFIKTYTDPGAVVLDAFLSSGTTAIAAQEYWAAVRRIRE